MRQAQREWLQGRVVRRGALEPLVALRTEEVAAADHQRQAPELAALALASAALVSAD